MPKDSSKTFENGPFGQKTFSQASQDDIFFLPISYNNLQICVPENNLLFIIVVGFSSAN